MAKLLHTYEIQVNTEKEWSTDTWNDLNEFPRNYAEWKNRKNNPTSLYYHSVSVTVLKWQNLEKEKRFSKRPGGMERGGGSYVGQFKGSLLWWELAVSLLSFLFSTKYTCDKIVHKHTQVSTNKTGKSE